MKIQTRSVLISLFILTGVSFGLYRIVLIFTDSADIGGIENSVVYFVQHILNGSSPYANPELAPYSIAQYPPLYYYFDVVFARLMGVGADDVIPIFIINRVLGLVFNFLYILSVVFICRSIFNLSLFRSLAISVFCFIFLESPSFARPDSLYLALYFWSLFFFFHWIKRGEYKLEFMIIFCAVLCGIGLFTKQTFFTLPFIICFWLLWHKKVKPLLAFTVVFMSVVTIFVYVLHTQFGLTNVYQNIVLGINNGISLSWFWDFIITYLFGSFGTIWILISIILYTRIRRVSDDIHRFSQMLLIILFSFGLFFSLKWGSWISYFTEWWTIVFILAGYYWDEIRSILNQFISHFSDLIVGSVLLIKIVSITYPLSATTKEVLSGKMHQYNTDKSVANWLHTNMVKNPGLVFVNNSNIHLYLNNLLFRECVLPQYEIVTYTLYDRKIFNYSDFKKNLQNGRIKYIIANVNSSGPNYMDNRLDRFKPVYRTSAYVVYRFE